MGRRKVDKNTYVYATKPEIRVNRRYRTSVFYDLYNSDGTLFGTYEWGDIPEDVVIDNAKRRTNFYMVTAPLYKKAYVYHADMPATNTLLNGYYYELFDSYYADNGGVAVETDKIKANVYSYMRKINRGFYERVRIASEFNYINAKLVKLCSMGRGLDHIMWFVDESGCFPLSATDYINMLLNGEKIEGIEPDSEYVVDIENIITPLGNVSIQEDINYYDTYGGFITEYLYEQIENKDPYYSQMVDYVSDIPEDSIMNLSDWKSHVEETIKFTGTSYINMQNLDEIFKTEPMFLTEDYNFPMFNVKRYQISKFSSSSKFFEKSNLPIMGKVVKGEVVDDTECIVIEKIVDNNGTVGWDSIPFEQIGDLIYDLDFVSEDIKNIIIEKYEEFKTIYSLLHTRSLRIKSAEDLGDIKTTEFRQHLGVGQYDQKDKYLTTSYGRIYVYQRHLDSNWARIQASDYGVYLMQNHTLCKEEKQNTAVPQRMLKDAGLVFGDHDDLLYLDVAGIYETFDGVEIMLAVQALDPLRKSGSIKPLFTYYTNFLVSDLPWVKYNNRYYIHTTLTDLIIPDTVFDNLVYEYNVLRPIRDCGDPSGICIDETLRRGITRKFADSLIGYNDEVGIFNFEV